MRWAAVFDLVFLLSVYGRSDSNETCLLQQAKLMLSKDVPMKVELVHPHAPPQDSAEMSEKSLMVVEPEAAIKVELLQPNTLPQDSATVTKTLVDVSEHKAELKGELVQPKTLLQDSDPVTEKFPDVAEHKAGTLEATPPEAGTPYVHEAPSRRGVFTKLKLEQRQLPTTTTSQSWLERIQESFAKFILGWVMFIFSLPILWFNERRGARMESLIARASSEARIVSADAEDRESLDCLVHVQKAPMHGVGEVRDRQFDAAVPDGCIRLRSVIEVFQHVETQTSETSERVGGGRETITQYSYTEQWSGIWRDSSSFQDKSKVNAKLEGLELGLSTVNCENVKVGSVFRLPEGLVLQCENWTPAHDIFGASVSLAGGSSQASGGRSSVSAPRFARGSATHYFMRPGDSQWKGEGTVRVGDVRVCFSYVPDGDVTVLALRVAGDPRDTFLPYRLIRRSWWGALFSKVDQEEEKRALRFEAEKGAKQLAEESSCGGGVICCACNLVTMCFSAVMTPEIFHLWQADMSLAACLKNVSERNQATTWLVRLAGWALMFWGLYLTFSPLLTLVVVIPFLGPILSNFGAWLIWVLCLVTTLLVSSIIVVLAYLAYHPVRALLYATLAAGACVATVLASRALSL